MGDPCDTSPGFGSGIRNWFANCRLRNPFRRDVIVTEGCVDSCGSTPCAAASGGIVTTTPTTIIPGRSLDDPAPMLEPTPMGEMVRPAPPPAADPTSLNRKTLYETQKPAAGGGSAPSASHSGSDNPLVDLPPLSAAAGPRDDLNTPPVPPTAESLIADSSASNAVKSLDSVPSLTPPPRPEPRSLSLTEGIARFKVVQPQLAGGSLPTAPGWAFLVEKGYRSVLDLRPRSEMSPGDDAAVHHVGLRYALLPVTPETIDETLLKRFGEEIAQAGNRPLYFFDTDGSRAGVLWYLHQVVALGTDEATAAKEVEELGPKDSSLWLAATTYLEARRKATAPAAVPIPSPTPATSPTTITVPAPATTPVPAPAAAPPPVTGPEAAAPIFPPITTAAVLGAPVSSTPVDDPTAPTPVDPTSWRPYAAMLVTGLSVPLAFIGRGVVVSAARKVASLPAPSLRMRSLPPSSDA
jgi:protein tyrosine phosphatase (PTP) superfamily phosphohydrolase (DUF442 family)